MQTENEIHDISLRTAELEAQAASMGTDITGIKLVVNSLNSKFDRMLDNQSEANKFPLGNSLAFATLIFIVMAALFAVMHEADTRLESALATSYSRIEQTLQNTSLRQDVLISRLTERQIAHQGDGHPAVQSAAILVNTNDIARVEAASVTNKSLEAELRAIHTEIDTKSSILDRLLVWQDRHDQKVPVINSRQDTKDIEHDRRLLAMELKMERLHTQIGSGYVDLLKRGK